MGLPTELEYRILRVFWDSQTPLKVREVRDFLNSGDGARAHTTVVTILNRMRNRGYLESSQPSTYGIYKVVISKTEMDSLILSDIYERVFDRNLNFLINTLQTLENSRSA